MITTGLYSYGFVLALGLLAGLYFFWKMGKDEHWSEISLFDAFFLSLLAYWVVGRAGYAFLHPQDIETVWTALALVSHPGIHPKIGMVGALIAFVGTSWFKGWNLWKAADLSAVAFSLILVFGMLAGLLHDPSLWLSGIVQLGWALLTFGVVARVKKQFRFYQWYKGYLSVARDGLAALIFFFSLGLYTLGTAVAAWPDWVGVIGGVVVMVAALCGIIYRAGRRK